MSNILVIQARFYQEISDMLLIGATQEIEKNNFNYEVIDLPGVFEIPATIAFAAQNSKYDGFIALGCVIRGQTSHYDYICLESARGINELAIKSHLAIGYGILTTENKAQAIKRADPKQGNKGKLAAIACLKMIELKKQFL